MKSVIAAYKKQTRAYFVTLVSPKLFSSDQVKSFADFQRLASGPLGQPDQSEVQALAQELQGYGVYLRYISKDLRTAALIGTVPALVNAPAAPVNDGDFVTIKDAAGDRANGMALIEFGGVVVGVGAFFKNPMVVTMGLGFAWVGLLIVTGSNQAPPPPPKPSSDNIDTPNDLGDPENPNGDIEIPSAVAYGEPENGINMDSLLQQLGTGTLDQIINNLPLGWDPGSGSPLAGIGGGDSGGGDGGEGGGGIPDWG